MPDDTLSRTVIVYSREGCGLCDELLVELSPALRDRALELRVVSIDGAGDELYYRHRYRIPVVEFRGAELAWGRVELAPLLAAVDRLLTD